jgi:formylglycine-generating enzyme
MKNRTMISRSLLYAGFAMVLGMLCLSCAGNQQIKKLLPMEERLASLSSEHASNITDSMIFIEGGTFLMGSDEHDIDEIPQTEVTVDDFYLDPYPVTNEEFAVFITETGYTTTAEEKGVAWIYHKGRWEEMIGAKWDYLPDDEEKPANFDTRPVVMVSWYDASEYCKHYKKRLPSEAEWEYAASGPDHTMYPLGDVFNPEDYAVGLDHPVAVGQYPANPFGLYDMGGGVWEWTNSWYDYYPYDPLDGREMQINPDNKYEKRVPRGASWANFPEDRRVFRCANRSTNGEPDNSSQNIGFRCAF